MVECVRIDRALRKSLMMKISAKLLLALIVSFSTNSRSLAPEMFF